MHEVSLDSLMASMLTTGFQASHLGQAIQLINTMVGFLY
jgi:deoxyhypusine synthase